MALLATQPTRYTLSGLRHIPCTNYKSKAPKTLFPTTICKHREPCRRVHYTFYVRDLWKQNYNCITSRGMSPPNLAARAAAGDENQDPNSGKFFISDHMVVKGKKNVFWDRKWNTWDIVSIAFLVANHFLCLFAPFTFSWGAFWVAVCLGIITGLGITLCYHRLLTHRSFKLPKWLEHFFAYCGVLAGQRDPIFWVSTHRCHHQFPDTTDDPHSPNIGGFWFSHMGWIFDNNSRIQKCDKSSVNVQDLEKQAFYKFLERTYLILIHLLGFGAILYVFGGFPYLVWGWVVRIVVVNHITWSVNSVAHTWGTKAWNTSDQSRNNWWLGILALGEGWHNNHHAFENSARHGLEW